MGAFVAGCTASTHTIDPYRSEAGAAEALVAEAVESCRLHRGEGDLPPHPFTTDGCSMWPDSNWRDCCVKHDIAYWCGGSSEDRYHADRELENCVTEKAGIGTASAMYLGVRAGGPPWMPASWRWGYGWNWPRGYETVGGGE